MTSRCRLHVLCTFYLIAYKAFCLRLMELRIEEHTVVGNSTRIECKFDLEGEQLYTVKWYKDGNEFYRFLPGESPEVQVFDVTGVHVDEKQSTAESVILRPLELASSGKYRCEVSAEAPSFHTVTNDSSMLTLGKVYWKSKEQSSLAVDDGPAGGDEQDADSMADLVHLSSNSPSTAESSLRINEIAVYVSVSLFMVLLR